jgi:dipeptidyl aminopeptidase/acylaminoacyl peptidase
MQYEEQSYLAEAKSAREAYGIDMPPFSKLRRTLQSEADFNHRRNDSSFTCERITYLSDGFKVVGYIWRPTNTLGKKLPLIVYNRGGGQDFGKLSPTMRDGFYDFLSAGFIVIGSQYRGNDGGEGHDEEGGAEIADVLNLFPLSKSLGYVDTENVFMLGESRGGMMTFLALKHGARLNAVAVAGAESDLASNIARRPELEADNLKQIPNYSLNRDKALEARSAQFWPDAIAAPLLMLQGGKDWRVPPPQSLGLAIKLDALRKPYELVIYEGDDHSLSFHQHERDARIIAWFKAHFSQYLSAH